MNIIPQPNRIIYRKGNFILNRNTGLNCHYRNISDNLNDFLDKVAHFTLSKGNGIDLIVDSSLELGDEGYILKISDSVIIQANTEKGLFWGVQSLKQLIYENCGKSKVKIPLPCLDITDSPRFAHRGLMMDCCRHFFDVDKIKSYIDAISMQKLNIFHWHLTEDQGWRIELDSYPNLTQTGSVRAETKGDKTPYQGFFTKAQVREIVKYAADRYVDIIPEFDMPGHTCAVLASYPELGCTGKKIDVKTRWGIYGDILCAGKEETYTFIKRVLTELSELFPYEYVHLGGDEAIKTEWHKCPDCQKKMQEENLHNEEELQAYITKVAIDHLKTLNKKAICWNESINSGALDMTTVMQYWQEANGAQNVKKELQRGRKMIFSKLNPYYLDYPYLLNSLKNCYGKSPVIKGFTEYEDKYIGVEAPIWTEHIANGDELDYMVFPRLTALAETSWTQPTMLNYKDFLRRLENYCHYLRNYAGIKPASINDANPNFLHGTKELFVFLRKLIDVETVKRSIVALRESKKMRKAHK